MLEEARDYYWVEYRLGASTEWQSAHPVFSSKQKNFESLEPTNTFINEIPPDLQHRLKVQAFLEQRVGSKTETSPLMSPWERPVANMISVPLTYSHYPLGPKGRDDLLTGSYSDYCASNFGNAKIFTPLFNGSPPAGAQSFDVLGNTVDPMAAMSPGGAFFQTLGDQAADSAGALAGLGGSKEPEDESRPIFGLQRIFLQITLISPDGEDRIFTKDMFKDLGEEQAISDSLGQTVTVSLMTGSIPPGYALDQLISQMLRFRPNANQPQASDEQPEDFSLSPGAQPVGHVATDVYMHTLYFLLSELGYKAEGSTSGYISEPHLVASFHHLWLLGETWNAFDIINNGRRTLKFDSTPPSIDPLANINAGLWDSNIESRLFANLARSDIASVNLLDANSGQLRVLTESSHLADSDYSAETKEMFSNYLDKDLALVVPSSNSVTMANLVWWQVDPKTGQTLQMVGPGWGGVTLEELELAFKELATAASAKAACVAAFCGFVAGTSALAVTVLTLAAELGLEGGGAFLAFIAAAQQALKAGGVDFMQWCVNKLFKAKWVPGC